MRAHELLPEAPEQAATTTDEVKQLVSALETQYPGLDLWVYPGPPGYLSLSKIALPKAARSGGTGTSVMHAICRFADERHLTLFLSPSGDFGGTVSRLKAFYRRFGFLPNNGRAKDFRVTATMIRPFKDIARARA